MGGLSQLCTNLVYQKLTADLSLIIRIFIDFYITAKIVSDKKLDFSSFLSYRRSQ